MSSHYVERCAPETDVGNYKIQNYARTWTLAPFADRSQVPAAVKIHWGDDDVYFGEITAAELAPGGHGHGTFNINSSATDIKPQADNLFARSNNNTATGELIRCVSFGRELDSNWTRGV